ncbi:MAG: hypothetical protein COB36_03700 [Alphaproteobacteria bacterium]|nr:MAG: hypothetical protein COB36_03700 [Alphaproteobacteria bacterium]
MIDQDAYDLIEDMLNRSSGLGLEEAKESVESVLKGVVEYGHRLHHPFFYEIRPLVIIAEYLQKPNVRLKFCSQHEQYDGEIIFGGVSKKIEFTRAVDGFNEALQMELLKKRGMVPAFRKIEATGSKHKRVFGKNETSFVEVKTEKWFQKISDGFVQAYEKKLKNDKYSGYWLCITFDDWVLPKSEEKSLFNKSCQIFWARQKAAKTLFERVFIVGDSSKFLWDSNSG